MYAIVETGGKQYRVSEGDTVKVERLDGEEGSEIVFDRVLALFDGKEMKLGQPFLENSQVRGRLLSQGRSRKIIVFKYKPKKNYRRKKGHRQSFTQVRIDKIVAGE